MKTRNLFLLLVVLLLALFATSCVTKKKFIYMESKYYDEYDKNKKLEKEKESLTADLSAITKEYQSLLSDAEKLIKDTAEFGESVRSLRKQYDQLKTTYDLLSKTSKKAIEGSTAEIIQMQNKLMEVQKELDTRELLLNQTAQNLQEKEKRLTELQEILDKQKALVENLKKKVSVALLGFENNGLTVNMKNGKVYISLEEKLMFATGSTKVDAKGEEALKKLAEMLSNNKDINVLVEGHTDNVPYVSSSGCIKDNWDLSVMRATAIIKILLKNTEISPIRLTAAGRGEFLPIDTADTKEALAKNRRIEIILTPKLDELFKIIESN